MLTSINYWIPRRLQAPHLPSSEVHQHVIQMSVSQANNVANHRHDSSRASIALSHLPPFSCTCAGTPQLPKQHNVLSYHFCSTYAVWTKNAIQWVSQWITLYCVKFHGTFAKSLFFPGKLRTMSFHFFEKHMLHIEGKKIKSTFYNVHRIVSSWSRIDISPSFSRKGSNKSLLF